MGKRALLLSPEVPYPMAGGGALRTASVAEYLGRHFELDVVTFRQPGAPDPRGAFPAGLARSVAVIDLPVHSKAPHARLGRNLWRAAVGRPPLLDRFAGFAGAVAAQLKRYDLGIIEHMWCAPYAETLRPHCARLWLDLHNIESRWHSSLAENAISPIREIHRRFATCYERIEREWLPRFDLVLTTSEDDARRIQGSTDTAVYPNALPFVPCPAKKERREILFTGNLEYEPNVGALRFFRDSIWPDLRERWPGLVWAVAGRNAEAVRGLLHNTPGCVLEGPMENAVERIAQAMVAIVPLRAGSGTRLKILEAWAAGTAVVSTSLGAEGLGCVDGSDVLIADTPGTFADRVSHVLGDSAVRKRIGDAGRHHYEESFTWNAAWRKLDEMIWRCDEKKTTETPT